MKRFLLVLSGLLALSVLPSSKIWTQPGGGAREGEEGKNLEVLTRGPLHEAFAQPYNLNPAINPIVPKKPPNPIEEMPPDLKPEGDNVLWLPGYFAWDEETADFIWISGFWRNLPPGRIWVPGHWAQADGGWQWISGYWATPSETEVEYLPIPPRSLDTGPTVAAPEADNLYAPGCWIYREDRYFWRPGYWYEPRPNWIFNPAYYVWTPGGCIFREGHWDHNLGGRGLLFAPVRFTAWESDWHYRPRYTLSTAGVFTSLFIRPDYHRYYFGDYYDAEYTRLGFTPWFQYRVASNTPDPLFGYYRWRYAKDYPNYEQRLVRTYEARREGTLPRPPANLAEQRELVQRFTAAKDTKMLSHVALATPLNEVDAKAHRLQPLNEASLAREVKISKQVSALVQERSKVERHEAIKETPPKTKAAPRRVKLALPPLPEMKKGNVDHPAHPTLPTHVERPLPKHEEKPPLRLNPKPEVRPASKQPPPHIQEKTPPPKIKDAPPPPKVKDVPPPPRRTDPPKPPPPPPKEKPRPERKDKGQGDDSTTMSPVFRQYAEVTSVPLGARMLSLPTRRGNAPLAA